MKAKKAVKRLSKIEKLLSNLKDQFETSEDRVKGLFDSAKALVVQARAMVSGEVVKIPPTKANQSKRRTLTAEGRKKLSLAAKKRWRIAKKNGVNAVTGRPLAKTA